MKRKIALVTGASRGIGRAIATSLACDGYDIWLNYRSNDLEAENTAAKITSMGVTCRLLRFDVTDRKRVEGILDPLLRTDVPYVLINNAGFADDTMFGLMSDESWDAVLNVHLNGFFNVTRRIVPYMIHAREGRIINISSISGQTGNAGQVNYSAAKSGLIGASKALARELGKRGILVNVVAPGLIQTDMTQKLDLGKMAEHIPLGRPGTPQDVAGCVRFLCSEWANYVTGQVLAVNGGLYI